jgi:hypothetical protein
MEDDSFEILCTDSYMELLLDQEIVEIFRINSDRCMDGLLENFYAVSENLTPEAAVYRTPFPFVTFVVKLVNTARPFSEYKSSCSADGAKCSMISRRNLESTVH